MTLKRIIGVGIIILLTGYLIGWIFPIPFLTSSIQTAIEKGEYLNFFFNSLMALITLFAVFTALFKEDLRKIWAHSKIECSISKDQILEKKNNDSTVSSGSRSNIEANEYLSKIIVTNSGNIPSNGVEVYLEKLTFKDSSRQNYKEQIETKGTSLMWYYAEENSVNIAPGANRTLLLMKMAKPEQKTHPDQAETKTLIKLQIGNMLIDPKYSNGVFNASFSIYSLNSPPFKFTMELEWDGNWTARLSEMVLKMNLSDNVNQK